MITEPSPGSVEGGFNMRMAIKSILIVEIHILALKNKEYNLVNRNSSIINKIKHYFNNF